MFDQNDQNQQTQDASVTPVVDPNAAAQPAPALPTPDMNPQVSSAPLPEPAPAPLPEPAVNFSTPTLPDADVSAAPAAPVLPDPVINDAPTASAAPTASNDLLSIKQGALQDLTPLLDHLDQTPEEKFRTTMMLIQASDDQTLVQTAYDAAKSIPDEKVRAQALLDVVNEINYFTQQSKPTV